MPTVNGITMSLAARDLAQVLGYDPHADRAAFKAANLTLNDLMARIRADLFDAGLPTGEAEATTAAAEYAIAISDLHEGDRVTSATMLGGPYVITRLFGHWSWAVLANVRSEAFGWETCEAVDRLNKI